MKKVLLLALVVWAGAAFHTAQAGDKKKKTKQPETEQQAQQPAPVVLTTPSDSLSYAAGMMFTQGLEQYLKQQYQLDSIQTKGFLEGFREYIAKRRDQDFLAYKAGLEIATMVEQRMMPSISNQFNDSPYHINPDLLYSGFEAAMCKDYTHFNDSTAGQLVESRSKEVSEAKDKAWREQNVKWLEDNKAKEGVVTLPSGLQYKVITQGKGAVATGDQEVTVKYEGKDIEGNIFDSSYRRNPQTSEFKPSQVIKGWTEALTMMPEGSTWELYIPQELGYGDRPAGQIKPYSTLIFKVELISVNKGDNTKAGTKKPAVKADAKKATATKRK